MRQVGVIDWAGVVQSRPQRRYSGEGMIGRQRTPAAGLLPDGPNVGTYLGMYRRKSAEPTPASGRCANYSEPRVWGQGGCETARLGFQGRSLTRDWPRASDSFIAVQVQPGFSLPWLCFGLGAS